MGGNNSYKVFLVTHSKKWYGLGGWGSFLNIKREGVLSLSFSFLWTSV